MTKNCLQEAKAGKKLFANSWSKKKFVCMAILKNLRISKYQPVAKMLSVATNQTAFHNLLV